MAGGWLSEPRSSYDIDAFGYADKLEPGRGLAPPCGFTIEAELVLRPDEDIPWAAIFARSSA